MIESGHIATLKASGIAADFAESCGVFSASKEKAQELIGFSQSGLMFPYINAEGETIGYRMKLDEPNENAKYLTAKGSDLSCYFIEREKLFHSNEPLYIVEGEKKALCLGQHLAYGVVAAVPGCNGASKNKELHPQWSGVPLKDRKVYFVPDSDFFTNEKVYLAGAEFIKRLVRQGAEIHLVDLRIPQEIEKIGADDFIVKKGIDAFFARCEKPFWILSHVDVEKIPEKLTKKEVFDYLKRSLFIETFSESDEFISTLAKASGLKPSAINQDFIQYKKEWGRLRPEKEARREMIWDRENQTIHDLYQQIGKVVTTEKGFYIEESTKQLVRIFNHELIRFVSGTAFSIHLGRLIAFKKGQFNHKGQFQTEGYGLIDQNLCTGFLESYREYTQLKTIKQYSESPVLVKNTLVYTPGFDEQTGVYYAGPELKPSYRRDFIKKILNYPYASDIHAVNAQGLLVGSVIFRGGDFCGKHPMGIIQGDETDLGKSSFAQTIAIIATGREAGPATYKANDEALEKDLGSLVLSHDAVLMDNIRTYANQKVESSSWERSITDRNLSYRRLGTNERIERPNDVQFLATINEGTFSKDLVTRSVSIFLSEKNKTEDIDYLKDFAKDHRAEVLCEILGMVKTWMNKGSPLKYVKFPKFPKWAATVNGVLEANGIEGFLSNHEATSAKLDAITANLIELGLSEMEEQSKTATRTRSPKEWRMQLERVVNAKLLGEIPSLRGRDTKVGISLGKMAGRKFACEYEGQATELTVVACPSARGGNKKEYRMEVPDTFGGFDTSSTPSKNEGVGRKVEEKQKDRERSDTSDTMVLIHSAGVDTHINRAPSENFTASSPNMKNGVGGVEKVEKDNKNQPFPPTPSENEGRQEVSESPKVSENISLIPDASWSVSHEECKVYATKEGFIPSRWWNGEDIGDEFSYDVETSVIEEGKLSRICLGSAFNGKELFFIHPEKVAAFKDLHKDRTWICHNAAFDLVVTGQNTEDRSFMFQTENRFDTLLLARLKALATQGSAEGPKGTFTLATLVKETLDVDLPKEVEIDGKQVRMSYGDYADIRQAPAAYLHYNAFDTIYTFHLFQKLLPEVQKLAADYGMPDKLLSHELQLKASISAQMTSQLGFSVDRELAQSYESQFQTRLAEIDAKLKETYGYESGEGKEERLEKILSEIETTHNVTFPRYQHAGGEKELYSRKAKDLKAFEHIEFISLYLEREKVNKFLKTFIEPVKGKEVVHPGISILKKTGRASMFKPNLQQIPRPTSEINLRRIFKARPGHVIYAPDCVGAELVTLAQTCFELFKFSKLGEALNAGVDVHALTASQFLGKPVEEITKQERQYGKIANFGLPGGLGVARLVEFAKDSYGVEMTEDQAKQIKEAWLTTFPEMKLYLDRANKQQQRFHITQDFENGRGSVDRQYVIHNLYGILEGRTATKSGREYKEKEIDWAWEQARHLLTRFPKLESFSDAIMNRQGSLELVLAVKSTLISILPRSGRVRAYCKYTDYNNNPFQGRQADIAMEAWFSLWKAGFSVVHCVHDEIVVELPDDKAHELQPQVDELILEAANKYCPDIKMRLEGNITNTWDK